VWWESWGEIGLKMLSNAKMMLEDFLLLPFHATLVE